MSDRNIKEIDLRPKWLEMIQRICAAHLPETEVIAYGSRVTATGHEGSDLNLVVRNRLNSLVPVGHLGKVREAFSESNIPILVDILDWARIPDSFREDIERVGIVVFPLPKLFL